MPPRGPPLILLAQLDDAQNRLQANPDDAALQSLKAELEEAIALLESTIADLRPAPGPEPHKSAAPPAKEKWSKENHPAFQAGHRKSATPQTPAVEEAHAATAYKVNDTVLARWLSGDKAFYPARITSMTGSAANPIYYVTFKSYGNTETLRGHDIKPVSASAQKRKADGSPAATPSATPAPPASTSVISAAADIDPALASAARREPSMVGDGPPKPAKAPRKVKANKELEAGKNKWQDFTAKGRVGKVAKKESMFRTGEGVNARGGSWP